MPKRSPNLNKLVEDIQRAFSHTPYPGNGNLVPETPYLDLEAEQIRDYLRGKKWQDLTAESIWQEYKGDPGALLPFMTPIAMRYYLPAFLLMGIREYEKSDIIFDSVIYNLHPPWR